MIDQKVVAALREASRHSGPVATARLLDALLPEGLRQDTIVFHLRLAVPTIPLKTLIDVQGWNAIGPGPLTDTDVDDMLRPWWPAPEAEG